MNAYLRAPDGLPQELGALQPGSRFQHLTINGPCIVGFERTCPHGYTLSRLPLSPVLPPPIGVLDLAGDAASTFMVVAKALEAWLLKSLKEREGLVRRPAEILMQMHPRLRDQFMHVIFYRGQNYTIMSALRDAFQCMFETQVSYEIVDLDPTENGLHEVRLLADGLLLPSILVNTSE